MVVVREREAILSHFGFANCIVDFFSDYLVGRST